MAEHAYTFENEEYKKTYRHTTSHILAQAVKRLYPEIKLAIGEETDDFKACCLNIQRSMNIIEHSLDILKMEEKGMRVVGAVYHIEDGRVEFI